MPPAPFRVFALEPHAGRHAFQACGAGIEPATLGSSNRCSNQLSYPWRKEQESNLPRQRQLPGAPCAVFPNLTPEIQNPYTERELEHAGAMGKPRRRSRGVSRRSLPPVGGKLPNGPSVPSGIADPMGKLDSIVCAALRAAQAALATLSLEHGPCQACH